MIKVITIIILGISLCVIIAMGIVIHFMRQEINELFELLNDKRKAAPDPEDKSAAECMEDMKEDFEKLTEQIYRDNQ